MKKERIILHCDANSFFASVEEVRNPSLKNCPMAVGGDSESRHGIILAKNQLAKKFNIKTAETIYTAKQKCPQLVVILPHFDEYIKYSKLLNEIYVKRTDLVEPFGIDESWLDVTNSAHLFGTGPEIADAIRNEARETLGITLSVGVSFNKAFAKLGSDYKKPDATTVITKENMRQIVWGLKCSELIYVGEKAYDKLKKVGIETIGDLAVSPREELVKLLGKQGDMLWNYANGWDTSPVRSFFKRVPPKSVGNGMTFKRDLFGKEDLTVAVFLLCGEISARLKTENMVCNGVSVNIKDIDFKTKSRQCTFSFSTCLEMEIREAALNLILEIVDSKKPVRAITVTAINLEKRNSLEQLSLFNKENENHQKYEKLEKAMDNLKKRMGNRVVENATVMASDLNNDNRPK